MAEVGGAAAGGGRTTEGRVGRETGGARRVETGEGAGGGGDGEGGGAERFFFPADRRRVGALAGALVEEEPGLDFEVNAGVSP